MKVSSFIACWCKTTKREKWFVLRQKPLWIKIELDQVYPLFHIVNIYYEISITAYEADTGTLLFLRHKAETTSSHGVSKACSQSCTKVQAPGAALQAPSASQKESWVMEQSEGSGHSCPFPQHDSSPSRVGGWVKSSPWPTALKSPRLQRENFNCHGSDNRTWLDKSAQAKLGQVRNTQSK